MLLDIAATMVVLVLVLVLAMMAMMAMAAAAAAEPVLRRHLSRRVVVRVVCPRSGRSRPSTSA
jgi:hypothetical protein